jgi:beta-glucosidase
VFPQGLIDLLVWSKDRYGNIPTYITENGAAFFDPAVAEAAACAIRCAWITCRNT